jgi:hypothetical protein
MTDMSTPNMAGPHRASASAGSDPQEAPHTWDATRVHTQLAGDDHGGEAGRIDIGRLVGDNSHELLASCDPGPAVQQQFEHLRPEFIAIHDVATSSSRKLLAGIAAASKGAVQQLAIRRQGYGNVLATIEFVELPTAEGRRLRIYSTQTDADTATRHALACVLLGFSTLGVVLVGDMPGHTMTSSFQPLREAMLNGPWPNRQLLLLPLSTANALVAQGVELARGTGVHVRTTPPVTRPADAWNFISSTWARMRTELTTPGGALPSGPGALYQTSAEPARASPSSAARRTDPLPLQPMPPVTRPGSISRSIVDPLARYVNQLSQLTGMVSCCVFDVATGEALAHAGARPGPEELGMHGAGLLAAMLETSHTLGMGHALPEAAITLGANHLLLRAVPRHPGVALHAVLDKTHANLTLARLQIGRMDSSFDE